MKTIFVVTLTLLALATIDAQGKQAPKYQQPKQADSKSFDRVSTLSLLTAFGTTILDGARSQTRKNACESNRLFQQADGCTFSPGRYYAVNFSIIGSTVVLQRIFPKASRWFDGIRFGIAADHAVKFGMSFKF